MPSPLTAPLSRAEFYLCLARTLLAPTPERHAAMTQHLADDLSAIAGEAGYPVAGAIAAYRTAILALPTPDSLLQCYATLFLVPPAPVYINAGRYLDGAAPGSTVRALEQYYGRHGVARAEQFHDASDHVAVQLEFAALLLGSAATRASGREFLAAFVQYWSQPFRADLETATAHWPSQPNPYLHLARMLETAVGVDLASATPGAGALPARPGKYRLFTA